MLETFFTAFVTLFVIVDPLGTAAVFTALTAHASTEQQKHIARRGSMIASCLMLAFALCGAQFLALLGISASAFRAAGGLLLFVTAFRMVMGAHETQTLSDNGSAYHNREDIAVFPLAIPLLCGPGCMTATILLSKRADTWPEVIATYTAIIAVQLVAFVSLWYAPKIFHLLSKTGASILARVLGVVLAAMAVQFFVEGVAGLVNGSTG